MLPFVRGSRKDAINIVVSSGADGPKQLLSFWKNDWKLVTLIRHRSAFCSSGCIPRPALSCVSNSSVMTRTEGMTSFNKELKYYQTDSHIMTHLQVIRDLLEGTQRVQQPYSCTPIRFSGKPIVVSRLLAKTEKKRF